MKSVFLLTIILLSTNLFAANSLESKSYLYSVPLTEYTASGKKVKVEAQIGVHAEDIKKVESNSRIFQQAIEKAIAEQGIDTLRTKQGKYLLKGRTLYFLSEAGIIASEVNWNSFQF